MFSSPSLCCSYRVRAPPSSIPPADAVQSETRSPGLIWTPPATPGCSPPPCPGPRRAACSASAAEEHGGADLLHALCGDLPLYRSSSFRQAAQQVLSASAPVPGSPWQTQGMGMGTLVRAAVTALVTSPCGTRGLFQPFCLRANLQKAALSQAAFNGDEFLVGTGVLGTAGR